MTQPDDDHGKKIREYYASIGLGKWYCLEHSQYSEDTGLFPFHIQELVYTVEDNMKDYARNSRGQNKWQVIFIGTYDECHDFASRLLMDKPEIARKLIEVGW
jgi:hypothetical protein